MSEANNVLSVQSTSRIMSRNKISITFDGELVSLKLGSQGGAEMHYTTAIKISQMLRRAAMHAKLLAGDRTKTVTVAGLLTDATKWEDELQKRRVVTATMVPKGATIGR